jgi:hypothetical protein
VEREDSKNVSPSVIDDGDGALVGQNDLHVIASSRPREDSIRALAEQCSAGIHAGSLRVGAPRRERFRGKAVFIDIEEPADLLALLTHGLVAASVCQPWVLYHS